MIRVLAMVSLLLLGPVVIGADNQTFDQQDVEDRGHAAARDVTPDSILRPSGADWSLVSTEENSRLVARYTWQNLIARKAFSLEASAPVQKNAEEQDFLNLDGLAADGTQVKGRFTLLRPFVRSVKVADGKTPRMVALCERVNKVQEAQLAAERCPKCSTPPDSFRELSPEACTVEGLTAIGGPWGQKARQARRTALQAGCDSLSKLDESIVFRPVGASDQDTGVPVCSEGSLRSGLDRYRASLPAKQRKHAETIQKLERARETALKSVASLGSAIAEAPSAERRQALIVEKLEAEERLGEARKKLETAKAGVKKLEPDLVKDPSKWLANETRKKLQPVCTSYNRPDRSSHIVMSGRDQSCRRTSLTTAIAKVEDKGLRRQLERELLRSRPVWIGYFTISGGVSRSDFKFLDVPDLSAIGTFGELSSALESETETNSEFGVSLSAQIGAQFVSIGYDVRELWKGGAKTELCAPVDVGSSVIRCLEAVTNAPRELEQNLAKLEWRRFVSANLGLRVRAFYIEEDFRNNTLLEDEWEGQSSLYFLRKEGKGLNGGIEVAYDTAFDEWRARLFVGQLFKL